MARERTIKAKRRGLNPKKVIFVYVLVFLFVGWHQSGKIAAWFDDVGTSNLGWRSRAAFKISSFIGERIVPYGPAQLNGLEDRLLAKPASSVSTAKNEESEAKIKLETVDNLSVSPHQPLRRLGSIPDFEAQKKPVQAEQPAPSVEKQPAMVGPPAPGTNQPENMVGPPAPNGNQSENAELANLFILNVNPENGQITVQPPPTLTAAVTKETPPEKPAAINQIFNPKQVLLTGDSMMLEGLGPPLQRKLKAYEGLTINRDGRYGTGLCRLDAFDWLNYFDQLLDKYNPDLVVITLGANDPQDILDAGKKRVHIGTQEWDDIYRARVADILNRAEAKGAKVFWVGLPVMGREPYGSRISNINRLVSEACSASPNGRFWDGWLSVADAKGKYTVYAANEEGRHVRIRAKDSIHLTERGGEIMAEKFLEATKDWADYHQVQEEVPERDKGSKPENAAAPNPS